MVEALLRIYCGDVKKIIKKRLNGARWGLVRKPKLTLVKNDHIEAK